MTDRTERIRIRAYQMWEEQGRPEGLHAEHWLAAEHELAEENEGKPDGSARVEQSDDGPRT